MKPTPTQNNIIPPGKISPIWRKLSTMLPNVWRAPPDRFGMRKYSHISILDVSLGVRAAFGSHKIFYRRFNLRIIFFAGKGGLGKTSVAVTTGITGP
jgi:hypothetical protein